MICDSENVVPTLSTLVTQEIFSKHSFPILSLNVQGTLRQQRKAHFYLPWTGSSLLHARGISVSEGALLNRIEIRF